MSKTIQRALVVLIPVLLASCGESENPQADLREYIRAIDEVDADWRAGAEDAFVGVEYLATGDAPPASHTIDDLFSDVETNTRQLIRVTQRAIDDAREIDPPPEAERFHSDYLSVLESLRGTWEDGLLLLDSPSAQGAKRGNPASLDTFLGLYFSFQSTVASVEARMDGVARERNRLGESAAR